MKVKKIAFIAMIVCGMALSYGSAFGQAKEYKGTFSATPLRIDQAGDYLLVDIDIAMNDLKVKSPLSIELTPELSVADKRVSLPPVLFKGHDEYLSYERRLALMSEVEKAEYVEPYAVVRADKRINDVVRYRYKLPFEPWMADAKLSINRDECGCGNVRLMSKDELGFVSAEPVVYHVAPMLVYVQPQAEEIKKREVQAEVMLNFEVNKIDIKPAYMNNPGELAKIHAMMDELANDSDISIEKLEIIGYASPEGTLSRNQYLSEGRAMALRNYMSLQYPFPNNMYQITFGGENWNGLIQAVENLEMDHKNEVLNILKNVSVSDGRETQLMSLRGGAPYKYLLKNVFPSLRMAICKVDYTIKGFDLEETREVFKTRPEKLGLNEMFILANSYPAGSDHFNDVFETAARLYPGSDIANLNAATSALVSNKPELAEHYIDKIASEPKECKAEYYNSLGVIALLKGNLEEAEKHLNLAASMGLEEARLNVDELNKKKQNIQELESRKM